MQTLLLAILFLGSVSSMIATVDISQLRQSSDEELAGMLIKPDASRKIPILTLFAQRYRLPGEPILNPGIYPAEDAYPTNRMVPPNLVSNLFMVVNDETEDSRIRFSGLHVMKVLLVRTNITKVFEHLLSNPNLQIRLEAACTVVQYSTTKHLQIPSSVIRTLAEILTSKSTTGQLCATLECIAKIGDKAAAWAPEVLALTKHSSKKVRAAARATLQAIEAR